MNTKTHYTKTHTAINAVCLKGVYYKELYDYYKSNVLFNSEKYFIVRKANKSSPCLVVHNMSHFNDCKYNLDHIQFTIAKLDDFNFDQLNKALDKLKLDSIIVAEKTLNYKDDKTFLNYFKIIYKSCLLSDIIGILESKWV